MNEAPQFVYLPADRPTTERRSAVTDRIPASKVETTEIVQAKEHYDGHSQSNRDRP